MTVVVTGKERDSIEDHLTRAIGEVNSIILHPAFRELPAWAQQCIKEADEHLNGTRDGLEDAWVAVEEIL